MDQILFRKVFTQYFMYLAGETSESTHNFRDRVTEVDTVVSLKHTLSGL